MNKTLTSLAIVVLVIVGGLFLLNQGDSNGVDKTDIQSTSVLVVDSITHDFGEIGIFNGKVEKEFTLTNEGQDKLTILNGTTSCGCTEGEIDGMFFGMHEGMSSVVSLEPGESKILKITYDPLAHGPSAVGKVTRQIFLKTNSIETPELEIRISVNVVKEVN